MMVKKYTYTVLPFGPVNAPSFYTAMIRQFQAEWTHLFNFFSNNAFENVKQDPFHPVPTVPQFARSGVEDEFRKGMYLPLIKADPEFVLGGKDGESKPAPSETCTACTMVKQRTKDGKHQIVTGSRTVIDDILLCANCILTALLMFECMSKIFVKYRVSFKIKKCNIFRNRFEYVGRDILTDSNTTVQLKYGMVSSWNRPRKGDNLRSFVSFCNFYARFVPMFQIQCKLLRDLYM